MKLLTQLPTRKAVWLFVALLTTVLQPLATTATAQTTSPGGAAKASEHTQFVAKAEQAILQRRQAERSPAGNQLVASPAPAVVPINRPALASAAYFVYLPLMTQSIQHGIYGVVTENGVPANYVPLDLVASDAQSNRTVVASVHTTSDGHYAFHAVPSLPAGSTYYVRYDNYDDFSFSSRLALFLTRSLDHYTAGEDIELENFDVADIMLVDPTPGIDVHLSFPTTFNWMLRPVPTDSYQVVLIGDPSGYFTSPFLGYVTQYALAQRPASFNAGDFAYANIAVRTAAGGDGLSDQTSFITFAN